MEQRLILMLTATHWRNVQSNQNKRRETLSPGVLLHHDNEKHQTSAQTQNLILKIGWEQLKRTLYSPDLSRSNCHLLLHLVPFSTVQ